MIPRLLPANTTNFNTAGISLTDAISCKVTEERNGVFTLEMVVATTTPYFDQIKEGMLIVAKPNHTQGLQAFEICKVTRPILQRVTIYANHISYKQSFIPVEPFSCTGITATLQGLVSHSLETNPFTFTTTITNTTSTYNQIAPASLRSRLGGTEGSVLDVFGGEYLWDNYTTRLLLHRGQDNGVELRVGKNITDLEQSTELDNVITGVLPYWTDSEETQHFYGDIQYNSDVNNYVYHRTVVLDLSDQFETAPSVSQLNAAGHEYVTQANLGIPSTSIRVSYVDLADTDEYKGSVLERTNLCDTVKVIYTPLNISYQAKVIKLVFDVLAERTVEVEIGDARSTISKTITDLVGDVSSVVKTGKKLVSVTQKIDREVGEISSTVSSVEESTSTIVNMLYDTNAPSLTKVYADYDRQFSASTNDEYVGIEIVPIENAPNASIKYGARIYYKATDETYTRARGVTWYADGVVPITAGTTYTLSCYARIVSAIEGKYRVYFAYGDDPHDARPNNDTYAITTTEWAKFAWTFTASTDYMTDGGAKIVIGASQKNGSTAGAVEVCGFFMQVGEPSGIDTKGSAIYQLPSDLAVLNGNVSANTEQIQTVESHVNTVQQTAEENTRTISSVREDIGNNYWTKTETQTKIQESASSITTTFSNSVTNAITGEKQRVDTMIRESGDGIAIGKSGNKIEGRFDNDSLDFVDTQDNDKKLAWVDANEGLGGSALAVGDPSNIGNRWRIFTRQSGTHLTFTRHS